VTYDVAIARRPAAAVGGCMRSSTATWKAGLLASSRLLGMLSTGASAQRRKPVLHGRHWMAVTGKPLARDGGAAILQKKGNAVDAACAISRPLDDVGHAGVGRARPGAHLQPKTKKSSASTRSVWRPRGRAEFFKAKKLEYPRPTGAGGGDAGTPRHHGDAGEFGTMSLKDVLELHPDGGRVSIEAQLAGTIEPRRADQAVAVLDIVFLTHPGERARRRSREVFKQPTSQPHCASW